MVQRCKKCGEKIIKFPMWKGQEDGVPFSWDKVLWLNLFKIDWMTIIWVIVIILMMIAYKHDIGQCKEVYETPCEFCEKSNCCQVDLGRINPSHLKIDGLPDINLTEKGG